MRSKYLVISAFCLCVLGLYFDRQLAMYIHPRYIGFAAVSSGIALVLCVIGLSRPSKSQLWVVRDQQILVLLILAAMLLPARPLSAGLASQRVLDFNKAVSSDASAFSTYDNFALTITPFSIKEWNAALQNNPESLVGKKVDVTGFVFSGERFQSDRFYVTRFVITCCAVDARPVGLSVNNRDWVQTYAPNSWVRIQGMFVKDGLSVAIQPSDIQKVDQPKDPYEY